MTVLLLPNAWSPDCRQRPVAWRAGTPPAIAAASTASPATQNTVFEGGVEVHPERNVPRSHAWKDDSRQLRGELAGEQEPRDSCARREHEHLDENLQDDAAAARAQRVASRELLAGA